MSVIRGEMQNGAADHDVGKGIRKGHSFDGFVTEVICWNVWGEAPNRRNGAGIGIDGKDLVCGVHKIDEVSAAAAAGVEDSHAGLNAAAKELIEEVDVDVAELFLETSHAMNRWYETKTKQNAAILAKEDLDESDGSVSGGKSRPPDRS